MSAFALKIIAMVTMFIDHMVSMYGTFQGISCQELELHFTGLAE